MRGCLCTYRNLLTRFVFTSASNVQKGFEFFHKLNDVETDESNADELFVFLMYNVAF